MQNVANGEFGAVQKLDPRGERSLAKRPENPDEKKELEAQLRKNQTWQKCSILQSVAINLLEFNHQHPSKDTRGLIGLS